MPQSFIDDLVDRVDIVELIDSRVKLRKSGRNYTACCPFHDEKTPSFSVNQEKQFYHCFGCGAGGNAISFIMEYDRVSFPEAIEQIAGKLGIEVPREEGGRPRTDNKEKQNLFSILEKANLFYQEQLRSHPEADRAQNYLRQRGLSSQIAHRFGIGYAPSGWDNLLKFAGKNEDDITLLTEAGLIVTDDEKQRRYDRFRERIMFPIRDTRGRVIAFGGRVLGDDKPKYLNSPETPVFFKSRELYGLYEANKLSSRLEQILIVEGYMDVVALAQFDINFAAATLGTSATAQHLEKAFRYTQNIVFSFDGDEAGRKAARRALDAALPVISEGRQVHFLFLPEGEDPDTLVRNKGADAFLSRIRQAKPLSEYLFEQVSEGLNTQSTEGRSQLVARALPLLGQIPQGVFRNMMLNTLSALSQLPLADLEKLQPAAKSHSNKSTPLKTPQDDSPVTTRKRTSLAAHSGYQSMALEERAIFLLLNFPGFIQLAEHIDPLLGYFENSDNIKSTTFFRLVRLLRDKPGASINSVIGRWAGLYDDESCECIYQLANRELLTTQDESRQLFIDTLKRLKQRCEAIAEKQLIEKLSKHPQLDDETLNKLNELLLKRKPS
ncbi:MAG: DNA primase [Pseudomonadales bacterium]|nr:DNA primase [Pseudomonadales bacterium]